MMIMKQMLKKLFWNLPSNYILMFHHVVSEPAIKCSSCTLDTTRFELLIRRISSFCVSYDQLKKSGYRKRFVITFDDGLEDVYTVAYPILKKYQVPFIVFVVPNYLNQPGYLTTQQLLEMSKDSIVTIGSHGLSHECLSELDEKRQKIELEESKAVLEKMIHKPIRLFAYSHGRYNDITLALVKVYEAAFSVSGHPYNFITKRKKWELPRINITDKTIEDKLVYLRLR